MTKEDILYALRHVIEPDLRKDLITLNMVQDVEINGKAVRFKVVLTTPACPLKEKIEQDCIEAIHTHADPEAEVTVEMTANVTTVRSGKVTLPQVKNVIAVASGKGGVGKSTVAVNLALGLARQGAKVGLLDADIHGPSVPIMLGLRDAQPGTKDVDGKSLLIPVERWGVKVLSIGFMVRPEQAVVWRGPMISSALRQFVNDVDWGELDYLVLDLPPGTGDIHLTMAQTLPMTGVVIVTTPQQVALSDTIKAIDMFKMPAIEIPILGVVENMAYFTPAELPDHQYYIFGKGGGHQLAEDISVPFLGEVPIYQSIADGGDKGLPEVMQDDSPVQDAFMDIAGNLARQIAIANAAVA